MAASSVGYSLASQLANDPRHTARLSLGDAQLDELLGGGIDGFGVTEIAGEAGAGKTQLVLQLMLQAQLPPDLGGLGGGAVYLHGDSANHQGALKRLHGLATAFAKKHAHLGAETELLKKQIFVMQVDTPDDLWSVVHERVPSFLMQQPIRLIVVDSVGGLYRPGAADDPSGVGAQPMPWERAIHAMRLAARLKQISTHFNVAVVVVNQVSDKPLDEMQRRAAAPWELGPCGMPDGSSVRVPALGLAWSGCVNTRIVLTRSDVAAPNDTAGPATAATAATAAPTSSFSRGLHVAWSPRLPGRSTPFAVRDQGLIGQQQQQQQQQQPHGMVHQHQPLQPPLAY